MPEIAPKLLSDDDFVFGPHGWDLAMTIGPTAATGGGATGLELTYN